jgi:hypothetical protein
VNTVGRQYYRKSNGMLILSREDIEDIAAAVLAKYQPEGLAFPKPLDLQSLAAGQLGLRVLERYMYPGSDTIGMTIFGRTDVECGITEETLTLEAFESGTVIIDANLSQSGNEGRRRFTLAHEISHWLLHRPFHSSNGSPCDYRISPGYIACRSGSVGCADLRRDNDKAWEEWQANVLASDLLMPKTSFDAALGQALSCPGNPRKYCIAGKGGNLDLAARELADIYGVSHRAAELRLKALGYVRDPNIF